MRGFRAAGVTRLHPGLVPDAGHFMPEEPASATWQAISDFIKPKPRVPSR